MTAAPVSPGRSAQLSRAAVIVGVAVGVTAVSFSPILIRVADAPSLALALWRCLAAAAVLTPAALRALRRGVPLDRPQRRQIAAAGVFLALHFALFISSLSFTTVASAVLLGATVAPLFVGLASARFLREPPTRRAWAGMALAMAGAIGIAAADLGGGIDSRAGLGDLMALGGAVMVTGYFINGRAARARMPVSVYACGVYWTAAAVLAPMCLLTRAPLGGYSTGTWLAIAGLVIGPQLLGHTVFNALLSTVSATTVAVVVLAEPVGATALAWILLEELPAVGFWPWAALVLVGVWIAVSRPGERRG